MRFHRLPDCSSLPLSSPGASCVLPGPLEIFLQLLVDDADADFLASQLGALQREFDLGQTQSLFQSLFEGLETLTQLVGQVFQPGPAIGDMPHRLNLSQPLEQIDDVAVAGFTGLDQLLASRILPVDRLGSLLQGGQLDVEHCGNAVGLRTLGPASAESSGVSGCSAWNEAFMNSRTLFGESDGFRRGGLAS